MASLEEHLSRFELLAQELVEGSLRRLLGQRSLGTKMATKLAQTVESQSSKGRIPNVYRLVLSPEDHATVSEEETQLRPRLSAYITALAEEMQLAAPAVVLIDFERENSLRQGQVVVKTDDAHLKSDTTQVQRGPRTNRALEALRSLDAFVVVDGRRHIALDRPVMSIGRHLDSSIVVDSRGVSRRHAQIRWRFGRFVLYDLGSRGGTFLNGQPVEAAVLQPGDVITIGGMAMIYGVGADDLGDVEAADGTEGSSTRSFPSLRAE